MPGGGPRPKSLGDPRPGPEGGACDTDAACRLLDNDGGPVNKKIITKEALVRSKCSIRGIELRPKTAGQKF